ncbi:MAG: glycosyltransferase family 2 protein [Rikenellaceae bacterium]
MLNKFCIVIPVYNDSAWITQCLESVCNQDYQNYKVVVVDDHSTDGTWDIIKSYNIPCWRNGERNGSGLANIVKGIKYCSDNKDDIIVTVDGDDWLADCSVLTYLSTIYTEDVWLTYGSFIPVSRSYQGTCQPLFSTHTFNDSGEHLYSKLTSNTYRQSGVWVTSHLRTFRRFLWDQINDADLRDQSGEYFKTAWDMAFMYPMIEMAGDERIRFIDKILYYYNDLNPANDGKVDPALQIATGKYIQSKPCYQLWNR